MENDEDLARKADQSPTLKKYGVPIDKVWVHEDLLCEIYKVQYNSSKKTVLSFILDNNTRHNFVMIPSSANMARFQQNNLEYQWISFLFDAMGDNLISSTIREESYYNLLYYIGKQSEYQCTFEKVTKHFGLSK